jgi:hypothetical protein
MENGPDKGTFQNINHKLQITNDQVKHNDQVRGAQIFQKSFSHLQILRARKVR